MRVLEKSSLFKLSCSLINFGNNIEYLSDLSVSWLFTEISFEIMVFLMVIVITLSSGTSVKTKTERVKIWLVTHFPAYSFYDFFIFDQRPNHTCSQQNFFWARKIPAASIIDFPFVDFSVRAKIFSVFFRLFARLEWNFCNELLCSILVDFVLRKFGFCAFVDMLPVCLSIRQKLFTSHIRKIRNRTSLYDGCCSWW